jgi:hypothetical protein
MSAPNMPSARSLTSSPPHQSGSQVDAMDYQTMFNQYNSGFTSSFGNPNQSPFSNHQTSPFHRQHSPASSNLGLERLVLGDSPNTSFPPRSQASASPPFGDFDSAMANFNTGIPIESMLDVTSIGELAYYNSNVITEQTARLMRHYIDNLASWMDLSDSRTHFSTVVPKRALTSVTSLTTLTPAHPSECITMFLIKAYVQHSWKWC